MSRNILLFVAGLFIASSITAQTPNPPQNPAEDSDEVVRVTTRLVQTDVVVVDKNDQPIPGLKLSDFELSENGKKQELKFLEYVSVDTGRHFEGDPNYRPKGSETIDGVPTEVTAKDVKRVVTFLVDDLTIPFADMKYVRLMLTDFVDNKMQPGDLVAIVRTVAGKGLLEQFTGDKQLLKRSIAALTVSTSPYSQFNNPDFNSDFMLQSAGASPAAIGADNSAGDSLGAGTDPARATISGTNEDSTSFGRARIALETAEVMIESMKELPGRKSLVILSGGFPLFETATTGTTFSNVDEVLREVSDHAVRAGVVINSMDPRGLSATPGVVGFDATPARSALGVEDMAFSKGGSKSNVFGDLLGGGLEHQGLRALSEATGGVTVVNTNDYNSGLDKVLAHSRGYYILAYTPTEEFNNKFRKLQIKVKYDGARVFKHEGYIAAERKDDKPTTVEQKVLAAAKSPLAKHDIDVTSTVSYRMAQGGKANVDIDLLIDPAKLTVESTPEGKRKTSYDVVAFVYDQDGKLRGGVSKSETATFDTAEFARATAEGISFNANTDLPPGYYQLRVVVRDPATGSLGTLSRYVEIPDLAKRHLAMSSLFLYDVNPTAKEKSNPEVMNAARRVSKTKDLRYAAVVYNAKQPTAKIVISQNGKTLFQEPDQPLEVNQGGISSKIGQVALAKVPPGRYVLTVVVSDKGADKKSATLSRSLDFVVTN